MTKIKGKENEAFLLMRGITNRHQSGSNILLVVHAVHSGISLSISAKTNEPESTATVCIAVFDNNLCASKIRNEYTQEFRGAPKG